MTAANLRNGSRFFLPGLGAFLILLSTQAATLIVSNTGDSGAGSLRQAILDANATNGLDTITFQIPGGGPYTITPASALPSITDAVLIDGTTQPGFVTQPLIELNGVNAGANSGLRLTAPNNTVRGLVINRFAVDGISIDGGGTNIIQGNFIGTDTTGLANRANGEHGVFINSSSGNQIGGTNTAARNVISGNSDTGVYLLASGDNVVQGNYIGVNFNGNVDLGNLNNGITLYNSFANRVGGTTAGARNIISGNDGSGIYLFGGAATSNLVQGNYVGTDASGSAVLSNTADGITFFGAASNTIGGTNTGAGNIISGNGKAGIFLNQTSVGANLVQGNLIGTDVTGKVALGNTFAGITISGASSNLIGGTVSAARNVLAGNKQDGIFITTNSAGNVVQGNYIGVDATGTNALRNLFNGISIGAAGSNTIGGTVSGARNIISGNTGHGIQIFYPGARANVVQGNFIGPNPTGLGALNNLLAGVRIDSAGNFIGGSASGARNIISGNSQEGVLLIGTAATGNLVQGNFIGTSLTGTTPLANGRSGVGISGAPSNTVGGAVAGAGNLVSANGDAGIYLIGNTAVGNLIQANLIGADATGNSALANTHEGIYLERALTNTIGGVIAGAGNLISGNTTRGLYLTNSSWNVIQGNLIGTRTDGITGLGNRFHAIEFEMGANWNTVGGLGLAGNRIGFSQTVYTGVRVRDGSSNNLIRGNAIFSSAALGIDLSVAGVTANDACDGDGGANLLQNYPVLTQAITGSGLAIRGTLNSTANSIFLLQFFANPACDSTGYGEGQIFLGEKTVTTAADCTATFLAVLSNAVPAGYVITSTATDGANNTSEFSACIPVVAAPTLTIRALTNQQVSLTWTNTPSGFVLKQTASLSPPVQWSTVTNIPVQANNQFVLTLPVGITNRFYLLSY
jgi:parallel beta-helix repeat protein